MAKRTQTHKETITIARREAAKIRKEVIAEVTRLVDSGALDEDYSRSVVIGVALENIAFRYIGNQRFISTSQRKAYLNLKKF